MLVCGGCRTGAVLGYCELTLSLIDLGTRTYYLSARVDKQSTRSKLTVRSGSTPADERYKTLILTWAGIRTGDLCRDETPEAEWNESLQPSDVSINFTSCLTEGHYYVRGKRSSDSSRGQKLQTMQIVEIGVHRVFVFVDDAGRLTFRRGQYVAAASF